MQVNVSAVIEARVTCNLNGFGGSQLAGNRAPTVSGACTSSSPATPYRIRRVADAPSDEVDTAPKARAGIVVLSIEP